MNFIFGIFGSMSRRYLIRAYLISAVLATYTIWFVSSEPQDNPYVKPIMIGYAVLSAILFPFSKLVWDELRDTIMGEREIIYFGWEAIFIRTAGKYFVNVLLWFLTIFIAPFGILYLWFRNRL